MNTKLALSAIVAALMLTACAKQESAAPEAANPPPAPAATDSSAPPAAGTAAPADAAGQAAPAAAPATPPADPPPPPKKFSYLTAEATARTVRRRELSGPFRFWGTRDLRALSDDSRDCQRARCAGGTGRPVVDPERLPRLPG